MKTLLNIVYILWGIVFYIGTPIAFIFAIKSLSNTNNLYGTIVILHLLLLILIKHTYDFIYKRINKTKI